MGRENTATLGALALLFCLLLSLLPTANAGLEPARLTVRILGPDGAPVLDGGAYLELGPALEDPNNVSAGVARFATPYDGERVLHAFAPDHYAIVRTVRIALGAEESLNVTLQPFAPTLQFTVNILGNAPTGKTPLGGASVLTRWSDPASALRVEAKQLTDPSGRVVVTLPGPGTVDVDAHADLFKATRISRAFADSATVSLALDRIDRSTWLAGHATGGEGGVVTMWFQPSPGVGLIPSQDTTRIDPEGNFAIAVANGTGRLVFQAPNHIDAWIDYSTWSTSEGVAIDLRPAAVRDSILQGIVIAQGTPVANASVTASWWTGTALERNDTRAGPDGAFRVGVAASDDVKLSVSCIAACAMPAAHTAIIPARPGTNDLGTVDATIPRPTTATARLTVLDPQGKLEPGADVCLYLASLDDVLECRQTSEQGTVAPPIVTGSGPAFWIVCGNKLDRRPTLQDVLTADQDACRAVPTQEKDDQEVHLARNLTNVAGTIELTEDHADLAYTVRSPLDDRTLSFLIDQMAGDRDGRLSTTERSRACAFPTTLTGFAPARVGLQADGLPLAWSPPIVVSGPTSRGHLAPGRRSHAVCISPTCRSRSRRGSTSDSPCGRTTATCSSHSPTANASTR